MATRAIRAEVGLTVGIIILTLIAFGGLYVMHQRSEQARRDEAVKIADQNIEDQKKSDVALSDDETKKESSNGTTGESTGTTAPEAPSTPVSSGNSTDTSTSTNANSNANTNTNSSTSGNPSTEAVQNGTVIPQTGPIETLTSIASIAVMIFVGFTYIHSRQVARELREPVDLP